MSVKKYKPTTPARRDMTTQDSSAITAVKPKKSLTSPKKRISGRGGDGKITTRHRGGGSKRKYRQIDFRLQDGLKGVVESIEYDPNRTARIALIKTDDESYAYILAGAKMKVGDEIEVGMDAAIKPGNRLPLANVPLGSSIYNIEMNIGKGGQLVRSAGARAQLTSKEGDYAFIRLPSGEVRLIHQNCYATLGSVGNEQHQNITIGSAGRNRRKGKRPSVRGKAMNPADHPMGGGEGLSGPGRLPRTPTGKIAIGKKTRRRKRGQELIVRPRSKSRR
ncbi:MAG: 50S ribosomal protein L2 [Candidatus Saccharimonadales bacterium]